MLDFLSQNRLVALGLLLIAVYGATAYMDSDGDLLSNDIQEQAEIAPERVEAGPEGETRPRRRNPRPPTPEEFNEATEDGDEGLIDDTAGFDPSPQGFVDADPSSDYEDDNEDIPETGGIEVEGEISVIVDTQDIAAQFG